MSNKNNPNPSWLKDVLNTEKKEPVEAFQAEKERKLTPTIEVIDYAHAYIINKRSTRGVARKNIALRLEESLANEVDAMAGSISQNDAINSLIEYAIADLKARKKAIKNK